MKQENIEMFRDHLSTSGTSDFLAESAIVPSDQTVKVAYYSQRNQGLRRYKNVVIHVT